MNTWYEVENADSLRTPCLLVYPDRVTENINRLLKQVSSAAQVRPHIKTHKSANVIRMLLERGITQFKCATLREAQVLAESGAPDILLAYPLVGPAAGAWMSLLMTYPDSRFSCLADSIDTASVLEAAAAQSGRVIDVYLDLNVGMNRTGVCMENAYGLARQIREKSGVRLVGLHAYDGQLLGMSYEEREMACRDIVEQVFALKGQLETDGFGNVDVVMGGSCSFPFYSGDRRITCSPGTFVYWDHGYTTNLPEQPFEPAAVLLTRVVSKPSDTTICIDLGYKAIASENPLEKRFYFISDPDLHPVGHSEEHLVVATSGSKLKWDIGDELYVIPYHICPTVAMYEKMKVISGKKYTGDWLIEARGR